MTHTYTVAVVGATGVVGQELILTLEQRNFPVKLLLPLASARSAGSTVRFKGSDIEVKELTEQSFEGVDYALFSAGGSVSEVFAPIAAKAGCVVIDNTSFFRMHPDVPLVVPEVNPEALAVHNNIIANPNCSTAQLVMALKPIHDKAVIKRVVVSTYQSVSGAGKDAMDELSAHTRASLQGANPEPEQFVKQIAFNVIPQIDDFTDNGYTKEEMKMINETQKILGANIKVTATTVRVPVFIGHSESVNIQTELPLSVDEVKQLLSNFDGVEVMDNASERIYPTPRETAGEDAVFVGRIRQDVSQANTIEMWVVSDNLRKGAALNAVQIAEALIS